MIDQKMDRLIFFLIRIPDMKKDYFPTDSSSDLLLKAYFEYKGQTEFFFQIDFMRDDYHWCFGMFVRPSIGCFNPLGVANTL